MYQAVSALADISTYRNVVERLEQSPAVLLLRPEIGTIGLLDFPSLDEGIEAGRRAAKAEEATFKRWSGELKRAKEQS